MTFNKLKFMLIIQGFAYANKPIYLMFIRHAEKKPVQPKNLSPVGWQRAEYISKLFTGKINGHPCLSEFLLNNTIYKLFAHRPTSSKPTIRTIETLIPLSKKINLDINTSWAKTEIISAIQKILGQEENISKLILLSVSHGKGMRQVLKHFNLDKIAGQWDNSRYDLIWIFVVQNGNAKLISLPQNLMHGDINYMMLQHKEDLSLICPKYLNSL